MFDMFPPDWNYSTVPDNTSQILFLAARDNQTALLLSPERHQFQSAFLFLFFVLALTVNLAIMFKLWTDRRRCPVKKLSSVRFLYFQLAIADLLAAFCCILASAIMCLMENFVAGDAVCKVLRFCQKLGLAASTFLIVSISLARCIAVLLPLHKLCLRKMVKCLILGSWTLAVFISVPQLFIFKVNLSLLYEADVFQCDYSTGYTEPWQETVYDLLNMTCLYLVPLICISVCYGLIVDTVSRQADFSQGQVKGSPDKTDKRTLYFIQARKTSLAVAVVVVATFVLCWGPGYITLLVCLIKRPNSTADVYGNHAIYFCGLGHSVMNPLLYGAINVWWQALKSGFCCRRTGRGQSGDLTVLTSSMDLHKTRYQSLRRSFKTFGIKNSFKL